jgi:hypothetical protein
MKTGLTRAFLITMLFIPSLVSGIPSNRQDIFGEEKRVDVPKEIEKQKAIGQKMEECYPLLEEYLKKNEEKYEKLFALESAIAFYNLFGTKRYQLDETFKMPFNYERLATIDISQSNVLIQKKQKESLEAKARRDIITMAYNNCIFSE